MPFPFSISDHMNDPLDEPTIQNYAMTAMKAFCDTRQKEMRARLPASKKQNPGDADSNPCDAAVVLHNSYLIGFEFKVLCGDKFKSWKPAQHAAYLALTSASILNLPLYYAYNSLDTKAFCDLYNKSAYTAILDAMNVSTPADLPGKQPVPLTHDSLHSFLTEVLDGLVGSGASTWNVLYMADLDLMTQLVDGFPNMIWLVITAKSGLRLSWALTGQELLRHVAHARAIWNQQQLSKVPTEQVAQAYREAIQSVTDYMQRAKQDSDN